MRKTRNLLNARSEQTLRGQENKSSKVDKKNLQSLKKVTIPVEVQSKEFDPNKRPIKSSLKKGRIVTASEYGSESLFQENTVPDTSREPTFTKQLASTPSQLLNKPTSLIKLKAEVTEKAN